MPLKPKTSPSEAPQTKEEIKQEANAAVVEAKASASLDVPANRGILSDKIAFVCCLGDPSRLDITPANPAKEGSQERQDPTIVGYRFKALVDMDVPDVEPGADFQGLKNPMSYSGDVTKKRRVKAGETFDLTRFETGVLVSSEEVNAKIFGNEDLKVIASYVVSSKKTASGAVVKATTALPTVTLRSVDNGKSVKDVPFVNVLTFEAIPTGKMTKSNKPMVRKVRKIIPGFEKWSKLCEEAVRVSTGASAGASAANSNARNKGALAFLQALNKQASKQ